MKFDTWGFFEEKKYAKEIKFSWFQTFAVFWILYVFFWVFPRRPIVVCRRFGTLYLFHLHRLDIQPIKMEQIECSETSAYNNQTPGKYPKEYIQEIKFRYNLTRIKGTLHEDLCTVLIVSHRILLIMRNVSDKTVDKPKHVLCSVTFFFRRSYRLWGNAEKYGKTRQVTDDNTIRRMGTACWIIEATDTHSECVIKGKAIPLQAWTGPEGSRRLRLPDLKTIGKWRW